MTKAGGPALEQGRLNNHVALQIVDDSNLSCDRERTEATSIPGYKAEFKAFPQCLRARGGEGRDHTVEPNGPRVTESSYRNTR